MSATPLLPAAASPPESEVRRILIVDDDRDFLDSTAALLRDRGYEIRGARTPDEVLAVARDFPADAVLLDIRLDRTNGLTLIEPLREIRPRIQCLMVTAYADTETAISAVRHGAYDFLRKPVSPPELFAALDRCFDHMRLELQNDSLALQLQQARKMEAIGRLAGGVAHDFNNVLMAILGNAEVSLATIRSLLASPNAVETGLRQIEDCARQAATITRQLLTFCRQRPAEPASVALNESLCEMEHLLRRLVPERIALEMHLAPNLPRVRLEAGQWQQVIVNLVVNAQVAMAGGGTLTIETDVERDDASVARVVLTVRDTGCGMSPETARRAFEPFFTTKHPDQGTGLGLATVYGIVTRAGGRITLDTAPDAGSTFRILLPAETSTEPEPPSPPLDPPPPAGGEPLMLCEDNGHVRDVMTRALAAGGYEVLAATSAEEALDIAAARPERIAALVTDLVLPGMSGYELAEALRIRHPGLKVVLTSGYAHDVIGSTSDAETTFLEKPYSPAGLLRVLGDMLHAST